MEIFHSYFDSGDIDTACRIIDLMQMHKTVHRVETLLASKGISVEQLMQLHPKLGHWSFGAIEEAVRRGHIIDRQAHLTMGSCEACMTGKQKRKPFGQSQREWGKAELLHVDLVGHMPTRGLGGHKWLLTVVEHSTRYGYVQPLTTKREAAPALITLIKRLERQTNAKVKAIRSDRGGEFINASMRRFCNDTGIKQEPTMPYTPQSNGLAERYNGVIMGMVRTQLVSSKLPKYLWPEAAKISCFQRNRLPHDSLGGKTPWECMHGRVPDVTNMQPFGARCSVLKKPKPAGSKLDPNGMMGTMVGYSDDAENYGYRVLLDARYGSKIVESRDVEFKQHVVMPAQPAQSPAQSHAAHQQQDDDPYQDWDMEPEDEPTCAISDAQSRTQVIIPAVQPTVQPAVRAAAEPDEQQQPDPATTQAANAAEDSDSDDDGFVSAGEGSHVASPASPASPAAVQPLRRTDRVRRPPERYGYVAVGGSAYSASTPSVPNTYKQTQVSPDAARWDAARSDELQAMLDNGVMTPATLPKGRQAIPCKFVYAVKKDQHGNTNKFKARLVAQGFREREGIDYNKVFAPVTMSPAIRTAISHAAAEEWHIRQFDVSTAFLHAPLEEEIYVTLPPEAGMGSQPFKLNKAIYGLKQSSRAWYNTISKQLTAMGFSPSKADPSMFIKLLPNGDRIVFIMHVDDVLVMGRDLAEVQSVIDQIGAVFPIKDLGEAGYFLGMEVTRDSQSGDIFLSQQRYTQDLLERLQMDWAKPKLVPLSEGTRLTAKDGDPLDADQHYKYREIVGSLMYLATQTRPDLSQSVGALARHFAAPTTAHMKAAYQVLKYVASTRKMGIRYRGRQKHELVGYCDADFAGNLDNRRSTTGYVFVMNGGAISWSSRLQNCVATSTAEAEYMAASATAKEAVWLRTLMGDLGVRLSAVEIMCDNQAALKLLGDPINSGKSKHIDVAYHFGRERAAWGQIRFEYIPTAENVADCLTKAVPAHKLEVCRDGMGIT